jgi:hypothetical protein
MTSGKCEKNLFRRNELGQRMKARLAPEQLALLVPVIAHLR